MGFTADSREVPGRKDLWQETSIIIIIIIIIRIRIIIIIITIIMYNIFTYRFLNLVRTSPLFFFQIIYFLYAIVYAL
jgi:hypothetical protein